MFNKKKNNKGFTLVELLVVIAIIGILAVIAVPQLFKNIEKSKVSKLEADYNSISTAIVSYYADKNEYPVNSAIATKVIADNGVKTVTGLDGYLDEVANPFKANYSLSFISAANAASSGDSTTPATQEGVQLHISNLKITDAGINKLKNDLGADKVTVSALSNGVVTLNIGIVGTPKAAGEK